MIHRIVKRHIKKIDEFVREKWPFIAWVLSTVLIAAAITQITINTGHIKSITEGLTETDTQLEVHNIYSGKLLCTYAKFVALVPNSVARGAVHHEDVDEWIRTRQKMLRLIDLGQDCSQTTEEMIRIRITKDELILRRYNSHTQ